MLKFEKFVINEAKKSKELAEKIKKSIIDLFDKCPKVEKSNDNWPTEKCLYSLSGIKSYIRKKLPELKNNTQIDNIFQDYSKELKYLRVKNNKYGDTYPYYYNSDKVSESEAKNIKEEYEKYSSKE